MNKIFNFQFSFFNKVKFFLRKPVIVVVIGQEKKAIKEAIFWISKEYFKIGKEIIVLEADQKKIGKLNFFLKNSKLPILVITDISQSLSVNDFLLEKGRFVLNCDNEKARELVKVDNLKSIKFGSKLNSDVFVSDIKENGGTNLKVNYKGSIVPFWFNEKLNKKQINVILSVVSVGIILGLNLVKISQSFRDLDF